MGRKGGEGWGQADWSDLGAGAFVTAAVLTSRFLCKGKADRAKAKQSAPFCVHNPLHRLFTNPLAALR
jgi:hypothetical protein